MIDITGVPSIIYKGIKITDNLCNIATRLDQGQYVGGVVKAITFSAKYTIDGIGVATHILNVVAPGSGILTEMASDVIQLGITAIQCLYDLLAAFSHEYLDITILSPANIHVYDSYGNHVGLNGSNMIETQIPNSICYVDQQNHTHISIFEPANLNYTLITEATETGNFSLIISHKSNGRIKTFEYKDVQQPTLQTKSIIDINNGSKYNLSLDLNGDGIIDIIKVPDLIKTNFVPNASIQYPSNGMLFSQGTVIALNGIGTDLEDDILNDTSLHWVIDGCFSCSNLTGSSPALNTKNMSVGNHSIVLKVFDSDGAIDVDIIGITIVFDNLTPDSITNLKSKAATTYINWTWTNPPDPDFNHTEIYLDGAFQTITSSEFFNATNLTPETSYTISTRTADTAGNINQTWMNDTATTLPAPCTTIQLTIPLNSGWNLISAPLNLTTWELGEETAAGDPLNVTPENSLTSIYRYNTTSELFEKCTHYAGWGWAPATGSESFAELEPGRGYWVMAKNDCDVTFTGTAPSDMSLPLDANWNCIGWYSTSEALLGEETAAGDPLSVTPENSLPSIYRYNTTSGLFEKCTHYANWGWEHATGSESFTELEPGRGYWAWAENDCVWNHET